MSDFASNPIRRLEGITRRDLEKMTRWQWGFFDGEQDEVAKNIATIFHEYASGDPNKIDHLIEVVSLADVFVKERARDPVGTRSYPKYLRFAIHQEDIDQYTQNFTKLEWNKKKEEVKKRYALDKVQHPFVKLFDKVESWDFDNFRGLPVFDKLPDVIAEKLPNVLRSKQLYVLYPGSGSHIAPLLTAMIMIDRGEIEKAEYTYSEINPKRFKDLVELLQLGEEMGLFDYVAVGPTNRLSVLEEDPGSHFDLENRWMRNIVISYQGKPIVIRFANKMSGSNYYRPEYLERADVVILHDPGRRYLKESLDLASTIVTDKSTSLPDKPQLMVMEGKYQKNSVANQMEFPPEMSFTELSGPYGHCGGVKGVGEVEECHFSSAYVFELHQPAMMRNAGKNFTDLFCENCEGSEGGSFSTIRQATMDLDEVEFFLDTDDNEEPEDE